MRSCSGKYIACASFCRIYPHREFFRSNAACHFGHGARIFEFVLPSFDLSGDVKVAERFHEVTAYDVVVARESDERKNSPVVLNPVGMMYDRRCAGHYTSGFGGSKHCGGRSNGGSGDMGEFFPFFRSEVFNVVPVFVETISVVRKKIRIIKMFFNDDMRHCQRKGTVRARQRTKMNIGAGRSRCQARVHDNHFQPPVESFV